MENLYTFKHLQLKVDGKTLGWNWIELQSIASKPTKRKIWNTEHLTNIREGKKGEKKWRNKEGR